MPSSTLLQLAETHHLSIAELAVYGRYKSVIVSIGDLGFGRQPHSICVNLGHLSAQDRTSVQQAILTPKPPWLRAQEMDPTTGCLQLSFQRPIRKGTNAYLEETTRFLDHVVAVCPPAPDERVALYGDLPLRKEQAEALRAQRARERVPLHLRALRGLAAGALAVVVAGLLALLLPSFNKLPLGPLAFFLAMALASRFLLKGAPGEPLNSYVLELVVSVLVFAGIALGHWLVGAFVVMRSDPQRATDFVRGFEFVASAFWFQVIGAALIMSLAYGYALHRLRKSHRPEEHVSITKAEGSASFARTSVIGLLALCFLCLGSLFLNLATRESGGLEVTFDSFRPILIVGTFLWALYGAMTFLWLMRNRALRAATEDFKEGGTIAAIVLLSILVALLPTAGTMPWVISLNKDWDRSPEVTRYARVTERRDSVATKVVCWITVDETSGQELPRSACEHKLGAGIVGARLQYSYRTGFFGTGLYYGWKRVPKQ